MFCRERFIKEGSATIAEGEQGLRQFFNTGTDVIWTGQRSIVDILANCRQEGGGQDTRPVLVCANECMCLAFPK